MCGDWKVLVTMSWGVNDSRVALELFQQSPSDFDLVITDQTMPFITGLELASEILNLRSQTPIILCTGSGEPDAETKALAIGVRAFLQKPVARALFADTIRRVLHVAV